MTLTATRNAPSEILERLGDASEYSALIEAIAHAHRPVVYSLVSRTIRGKQPSDLIDDAMNRFCFGIWRGLETFDASRSEATEEAVLTWCVRKGAHEVRTYLRSFLGRSKPSAFTREFSFDAHAELMTGLQRPDTFSVPTDVEAISQIEVEEMLKKLRPKDREIVYLITDGESGEIKMSCECENRHTILRDIARITHRAQGTIEKSIARIRQRLIENFEGLDTREHNHVA